MRLYAGPLSLFSAKVRIALAEKAIPYEEISVPFSRKDGYSPKHPFVLGVNPKAQVPVLVDGDLEIYDSTVILEYLEDRYPEPPLYPRDPADKARCRQAEAASDEVLFPHVLTLIKEVFYEPAGGGDEALIVEARARIGDIAQRLDQRLAGREYVCGAFSAADIAYFLTFAFAGGLGAPPAEGLRHLAAWSGRMAGRPSVKQEQAGLAAAIAAC
jgi:glutathione S-transferase